MGLQDEMDVYDAASVSLISGETESYDDAFFPNVIRKKEIELIRHLIENNKPRLILDFGCGGGWLSLLLRQKYGFPCVGVDISRNMLKAAKKVCSSNEYVLCDATQLPFKSDTFDFVVGISILHHLPFKKATTELKRISLPKCIFLFMEPSLLNPLSAFGRKFFPMEAHTEGEKPFTPVNFKFNLIVANFTINLMFTDFFMTFPIARVSKILRLNPPSHVVSLVYMLENLAEKLPFIKNLNSNIVAIVKRN